MIIAGNKNSKPPLGRQAPETGMSRRYQAIIFSDIHNIRQNLFYTSASLNQKRKIRKKLCSWTLETGNRFDVGSEPKKSKIRKVDLLHAYSGICLEITTC